MNDNPDRDSPFATYNPNVVSITTIETVIRIGNSADTIRLLTTIGTDGKSVTTIHINMEGKDLRCGDFRSLATVSNAIAEHTRKVASL